MKKCHNKNKNNKQENITNIYRIQTYDSTISGYCCIGFIYVMLKSKSLLDYTNLFSPENYGKNDKIRMKKRFCVISCKCRKFEKLKVSYIFFYLGFLSQTSTNHRTVREGRGHFFKSSLPLSPASQTLRHQPGNYCRELTSTHSYQPGSNRKPLVSE